MSARDEAVEMIRRICPPHLSADEYGQILAEKLNAHAAEVRLEDAARLREERRQHHYKRDRFSGGIDHAADRLEEWAANPNAAPAPDDSETAILRGLLRAVECAALRGDLATIRRALADHTRDQKGGGRRG